MNEWIRKFCLPIIISWVVLLIAIFSIPKAYGYFDTLIKQLIGNIPIGQWINNEDGVDPSNVDSIIYNLFDPNNPDDLVLINYFNSVLFDTDSNGNRIIDEIFTNYTVQDLVEAITSMTDFANHFLKKENGVLIYQTSNIEPLPLSYELLLPGEYTFIKYYILQADLLDSENMVLTVSLTSTNGTDISDFAVEVLIDQNPFSTRKPFAYYYKHTGMTSSKYIRPNKVILSTFTTALYDTEVVIKKASTLYRHNINNAPSFPGDFSRFPTGPDLYLKTPSTFTINKASTVVGDYLRGTADGSESQLELTITNRVPRDNPNVTIIPIILVVSRGLSNSGLNPNTANIMPRVDIKVSR